MASELSIQELMMTKPIFAVGVVITIVAMLGYGLMKMHIMWLVYVGIAIMIIGLVFRGEK